MPGMKAAPPAERFVKYVDRSGECWLWTGHIEKHGYGSFWMGRGARPLNVPAHRFGWELWRGPIPPGLVIDHLCRVRACVNPDHLEPVTNAENIRRGNAGMHLAIKNWAKTHCPQGHEYSGENLKVYRGARQCRTCSREYVRRWKRAQKGNAP